MRIAVRPSAVLIARQPYRSGQPIVAIFATITAEKVSAGRAIVRTCHSLRPQKPRSLPCGGLLLGETDSSSLIGRKNYLFAGSDAGGRRAAALYSLVGSAKLDGLNPQHYLADMPRPYRPNSWPGTGNRSTEPHFPCLRGIPAKIGPIVPSSRIISPKLAILMWWGTNWFGYNKPIPYLFLPWEISIVKAPGNLPGVLNFLRSDGNTKPGGSKFLMNGFWRMETLRVDIVIRKWFGLRIELFYFLDRLHAIFNIGLVVV
jgi:hypothetical protein